MDWMLGLTRVLDPVVLLSIIGGTFVGIIVGVVPGIGAGIGMALMLPLIFFWPPAIGMAFITALWMADGYGASISSILINVPGGGGAAFTCLDGYPLTKQGRAAYALGLSIMSSAVGGVFGAACVFFLAPPIGQLVTQFHPSDYFWITMLGMTVVASSAMGDRRKGFISAGIGMLLSLVGIDYMTGYKRFTFSNAYLLGGLDFEVVLLGLFAIGRMVELARQRGAELADMGRIKGSVWQGCIETFRYRSALIRGTSIGAVCGALPGIGIAAATAITYSNVVGSSSHPETFGKGEPEGLVAVEAANNSVQGGALIPSFILGIPGSSSAAVFLGAMIMYGIRPGATFFEKSGEIAYAILFSMVIAAVVFVILGGVMANFFARVALVPNKVLIPVVLAICMMGIYATNVDFTDVVVLFIFGVIGLFMEILGYSVVPVIITYLLTPTAEAAFSRAMLLHNQNLMGIINTPVSVLLVLVILVTLLYPTMRGRWKRPKAS